jgi:hypothetical protein
MPDDNSTKIVFTFYSEIFEQDTTEIMEAEVVDLEKGYFKIQNIPLYAPKIAVGDIIWAGYNDSDGMLTYRKTVQSSGNSTIHVVLLDDEYDVDAIRQLFEEMSCRSEKINNYFALDIPGEIDYIPVKRRLDELENEEIIDYEESGLSGRHEYRDISFG